MKISKKQIKSTTESKEMQKLELLNYFYWNYGIDLRKYNSPREQAIAVHETIHKWQESYNLI